MRRLVVATQSGEFITGTDVEEHELVPAMITCMHMFPTGTVYLDGQLLPDETLQRMMAAAPGPGVVRAEPSAPAALPEPEKIQDYNETMQRAFNDVRKHHVEVLRDLAECTKTFGHVLIDHQKRFADEAARQRELTRKSLADVDLLGRSVKATEFTNVLARAGSNGEAAATGSGRMLIGDILGGFKRMFVGDG